ncbi:hypothetical protein J1605_020957 [Eschrichtius robustus]|uniref:Uncharacterized protein n=1 Tax=Eschrichtius robustus TaxID=9764 RepID=A0AB34HF39_ESCRO|nr:hypothetical protein J1605_020957 [Eschrichtius robustus]
MYGWEGLLDLKNENYVVSYLGGVQLLFILEYPISFLQPLDGAQVSDNTGIITTAMYPLNKISFTLRILNLDTERRTIKGIPVILAQRSARGPRTML